MLNKGSKISSRFRTKSDRCLGCGPILVARCFSHAATRRRDQHELTKNKQVHQHWFIHPMAPAPGLSQLLLPSSVPETCCLKDQLQLGKSSTSNLHLHNFICTRNMFQNDRKVCHAYRCINQWSNCHSLIQLLFKRFKFRKSCFQWCLCHPSWVLGDVMKKTQNLNFLKAKHFQDFAFQIFQVGRSFLANPVACEICR